MIALAKVEARDGVEVEVCERPAAVVRVEARDVVRVQVTERDVPKPEARA